MKKDSSKRNRNATDGATYTDKKKAYNARPDQKKYRTELNKANAESQKKGVTKVGDSKDMSHTNKGTIVVEDSSKNRARNSRTKSLNKKKI